MPDSLAVSVAQILVYPQNGYVNRLQTLASSWILAKRLGARFTFCWVPSWDAPADANEVFSASFLERFLVSRQSARDLIGLELDAIPKYVYRHGTRGWHSLRGHDRGEQALLPELFRAIEDDTSVLLLVIVAGGIFYLRDPASDVASDDEAFRDARRAFYQMLPLHDDVETFVESELGRRPTRYIGLHLRYREKTPQTPSRSEIRKVLRRTSEESGLKSVFVASDSAQALHRWHATIRRMGLEPWSIPVGLDSALGNSDAHRALADWRLLGRAERLIFFSISTYSTEASVAAGAWATSIPLEQHWMRRVVSMTRFIARMMKSRQGRRLLGRQLRNLIRGRNR